MASEKWNEMQTLKYNYTYIRPWDSDDTSAQSMADKQNRMIRGTPSQKTLLSDADEFDIASVNHDTERWTPNFLVGAAPGIGNADIDTTVVDSSYIATNSLATVAMIQTIYAVRREKTIDKRYFAVKSDMMTFAVGAGSVNHNSQAGIMLSASGVYDVNNFVRLVFRISDGPVFSGIEAQSAIGGVLQPTIAVAMATFPTTGIAFQIVRNDTIFELWYSILPSPNEHWIKIAEFDDPTDAFGDTVSYYEFADGVKALNADEYDITASFQHFAHYLLAESFVTDDETTKDDMYSPLALLETWQEGMIPALWGWTNPIVAAPDVWTITDLFNEVTLGIADLAEIHSVQQWDSRPTSLGNNYIQKALHLLFDFYMTGPANIDIINSFIGFVPGIADTGNSNNILGVRFLVGGIGFQAMSDNGGVETTVDIPVVLTNVNKMHIKITRNKTEYFLNQVLAATIITNLNNSVRYLKFHFQSAAAIHVYIGKVICYPEVE